MGNHTPKIVLLGTPHSLAPLEERTLQLKEVLKPLFDVEAVCLLDWDTYRQSGAASHAILWPMDTESFDAIEEIGASKLELILDERFFFSCLRYSRWEPQWLRALQLPLEVWDRSKKRRQAMKAKVLVVKSEYEAIQLKKLTGHPQIKIIPPMVHPFKATRIAQVSQEQIILCPRIPNRKADHLGVKWFLRSVFPRVEACLEKAPLKLVLCFEGGPPAWIHPLLRSNLALSDPHQPNDQLLMDSAIIVFPFRNANPFETGILQAMAAGKPIVTTGAGVAGLRLSPSRELFIADRPDSFATHIRKILTDSELAKTLGKHASEAVVNLYGQDITASAVQKLRDLWK